MHYSLLSWEEIEKIREKNPVVILPVGAVEAHGRHLPLDVDCVIPEGIAKEVGERTGSLILPILPYGHCFSLREYPGTISVSPETLSHMVYDICSELVRNSFTKILVLNGHGGNSSPIKYGLERLNEEEDFQACIVEWWTVQDLSKISESMDHADENEASLYLHFMPTELTKRAKQESHKSYFGTLVPQRNDVFGPSGYRGRVENISKEKGKKIADIVIEKLVKLVQKDLILEEFECK
ncbi:MAG: creatininase family protein [Candidatus Micrarchaeota archaeon]